MRASLVLVALFALVVVTCGVVSPGSGDAFNLQNERLSVPYRRRLAAAARAFNEWAVRRGLKMQTLLANVQMMAQALVAFIQAWYSSGKPYWRYGRVRQSHNTCQRSEKT